MTDGGVLRGRHRTLFVRERRRPRSRSIRIEPGSATGLSQAPAWGLPCLMHATSPGSSGSCSSEVPTVRTGRVAGNLANRRGTLWYWQAWAVTGTFLVLVFLVGTYYLRLDPDFLLHRMQAAKKRPLRNASCGSDATDGR